MWVEKLKEIRGMGLLLCMVVAALMAILAAGLVCVVVWFYILGYRFWEALWKKTT